MHASDNQSTRTQLLQMLKVSGPLMVSEMAERLGITEMAVRRHLHAMERDGLVGTTLVRQAMGRPSHAFSLTEKAQGLFPNNYHGLALDLLEELEAELQDADAVKRLFDRRKVKLVHRYRDRVPAGDLREKVRSLAEIQNESGYMAGWETGNGDEEGVYIIDEYNCPIARVANRYGHACQSELELFRELLGADVERVECIAESGRRCRYLIRERGGKREDGND
jgi:predicted ArsR family transcriptional regulator